MVATQSSHDRTTRRAAILLKHLDATSQRELLAHLAPAEATRLRRAAATLQDVDPLEAKRVVESFLGRVAGQQATGAGGSSAGGTGVSGVAGAGATGAGVPGGNEPDGEGPHQQLQFLSQVSDVTLLRVVQQEHPQTVAVVLGALPAQQAARLLKQLAPELRQETLKRLGRLEAVPAELLEEIADHLRQTVGAIEPIEATAGRKALTAILSMLDEDERVTVAGGLATSDGVVASALQQSHSIAAATLQGDMLAAGDSLSGQPVGRESLGRESLDIGERPVFSGVDVDRVAADSSLAGHAGQQASTYHGMGVAHDGARAGTHDGAHGAARVVGRAERSAELRVTHQEWGGEVVRHRSGVVQPHDCLSDEQADHILHALSPRQLQQVVAELSGRDALLTVCGLSERAAGRLLKLLPRRQAKEVRSRIESLGAVDFGQISLAKRVSAYRALELFEPESAAELRAEAAMESGTSNETPMLKVA